MPINSLLWAGALLAAVTLLAFLLRRRIPAGISDMLPRAFIHHRGRMRISRRLLPKLRTLLRTDESLPALSLLQEHGRDLAVSIIRTRQNVRRLPRLPLDAGKSVRLCALCRAILQDERPLTADLILEKLNAWSTISPSVWQERDALPVVLSACICQQLQRTLDELQRAVHAHACGRRLAQRLMHAGKPLRMLLRTPRPALTGAWALITTLRHAQAHELLAQLDALLSQADLSAHELFDRHAQHQALLARQIEQAAAQLAYLHRLDWQTACEAVDPLHTVFSEDPDGAYSRMDAASRRVYRAQAASLAHRFGVDEIRLARCCVHLARKAQDDPPRNHVGLYLMEHEGHVRLQRELHAMHGRLYTWLHGHHALLARMLTGAAGIVAGILCLVGGIPLFALPVFLCLLSAAVHPLIMQLLQRIFPPVPQVRIHLERIDNRVRTLLVLPATLQDASDAIRCVRTLLTVRESCPHSAIDCLLIGDFTPNITQQSAQDAAIITAAQQAVSALDEDNARFLYLQRVREWDEDKRIFAAKDGTEGAMACVTMMAATTASFPFAASTFDAGYLSNRYAYVLQIDRTTVFMPDALIHLIGRMEHPLMQRQETASGMRGFGLLQIPCLPHANGSNTILGRAAAYAPAACLLYRPSAVLEAARLANTPAVPSLQSIQACAGCADAWPSHAYAAPVDSFTADAIHLWQKAYSAWRSCVSALPGTPAVSSANRAAIRRCLLASVYPLCRLLLFFFAVALRQPVLFMLALVLPSLIRPGSMVRFVINLCMLPQHTALPLHAFLQAVRCTFLRTGGMPCSPPDARLLQRITYGAQGASVALILTLSLLIQPPHWGGLLLGVCFAAFPLLQMWLDAPILPAARTDIDSHAFLMDVARDTWQFFTQHVGKDTGFLPPSVVQGDAPAPIAETTPHDIALYLLACIAAADLRLCDASAAARRIAEAADSLARLPRWHGLFYDAYRLDNHSAVSETLPAAGNGLLCAALLIAAQAMRVRLPQLDESHHLLPSALDDIAAAMQLRRLYDADSGLFHTAVTNRNIPSGNLHTLYASDAMVLSFIAVMRRDVPASHWLCLDRTRVRTGGMATLLSCHGDLAAYLLPALLLPCYPGSLWGSSALNAIRLQLRSGFNPLFGFSEAPHLFSHTAVHLQSIPYGLDVLAVHRSRGTHVVTPYASAMALSAAPQPAARCLSQLAQLGLRTSYGYYDSIDLRPDDSKACAIAQCYCSAHQACILCAICNAAGVGLPQYISAMPAAVSTLALLSEPPASTVISPIEVLAQNLAQQHNDISRRAEAGMLPADVCCLGSTEASVLTDANLSSVLMAHGLYLSHFTEDSTATEGLLFAVSDGRQSIRLGPPMQAVFHTGFAEYKGAIGRVDITLTVLVDPVTHIIWHMIDLQSLAASERTITLTDLLLPALSDTPCDAVPLSVDRPSAQLFTASAPGETLRLCHAVVADSELLSITQADDCSILTQQDMKTAALLHVPSGETPCFSFRVQLRLPGRSHVQVGFATFLHAWPAPRTLPTLPAIQQATSLAQLHTHIQLDAIGILPEESLILQQLAGALLHTGLPWQGAAAPLSISPARLCGLGIDLRRPLLLLTVSTTDCGPLVSQCCKAAALLQAVGWPVVLCILATGSNSVAARRAAKQTAHSVLPHSMQADVIVLAAHSLSDGILETLDAVARLSLHDREPLIMQLQALRKPFPPAPALPVKAAHTTAKEALDFPLYDGGFAPASQDYIQHCTRDASPAMRWTRLLPGANFSTATCADGILSTHNVTQGAQFSPTLSEVFFLDESGLRFSPAPYPFGASCTTRIHHSPGATIWQSVGHDCDMRLTVCSLPDQPAGLRVLRIRNQRNASRSITLTAAVHFLSPDGCTALTPIGNCVTAQHPAWKHLAYFCSLDADAAGYIMPQSLFAGLLREDDGFIATPTGQQSSRGNVALLQSNLSLEANGSLTVAYLLGTADTVDEIDKLTALIRSGGVSSLARTVQQHWAAKLHAQAVSTPDEGLSLLINRILPMNFLPHIPDQSAMHAMVCAAATIYTNPGAMQAAILQAAATLPHDPHQRLALPLCTAWYITHSGDTDILNRKVKATSLYSICAEILTSMPLADSGLPRRHGAPDVHIGLIYITALRAYSEYAATEDQTALAQMYDSVTHAILAAESATPSCLHACWMVLAGLSSTLPIETEPANTAEAVCYLHALCLSGEYDAAYRLLQWMNPALNRQPACAPWQLDPDPATSAMYAAWMYIVLLEQLLGLNMQEGALRIEPHLPEHWQNFGFALRIGETAWQIEAHRDTHHTTVDGIIQPVDAFFLTADNRSHHVVVPFAHNYHDDVLPAEAAEHEAKPAPL